MLGVTILVAEEQKRVGRAVVETVEAIFDRIIIVLICIGIKGKENQLNMIQRLDTRNTRGPF